MKKGEIKSKRKCVMYQCQNLRYMHNLLCYNHYQIKDKLFTYRNKYGDLKERNGKHITVNLIGEKGNVKKPIIRSIRL